MGRHLAPSSMSSNQTMNGGIHQYQQRQQDVASSFDATSSTGFYDDVDLYTKPALSMIAEERSPRNAVGSPMGGSVASSSMSHEEGGDVSGFGHIGGGSFPSSSGTTNGGGGGGNGGAGAVRGGGVSNAGGGGERVPAAGGVGVVVGVGVGVGDGVGVGGHKA